ncbi:MAG: hypothetical protein ACPG47_03970 [Leucothrix sp.]
MNLKMSLVLCWLVIVAISVYAVATLGINWPQYFFGDMLNNGWRMQFNVDLVIHLLLLCFWVIWREESRATGIICALLFSLGGLFTLLYLLHRLHKANGSIKGLLLGRHVTPAPLQSP